MRVSKNAIIALSSTLVATTTAFNNAFSASSKPIATSAITKSFIPHATNAVFSRSRMFSSSMISPKIERSVFSISNSKHNSVGLQMSFFSNFFGGGGAYDQKINYSVLDFPGNELGQAAMEQKVLTHSKERPALQIATFAGGCFWGIELLYQRIEGVAYTAVGYTQGREEYPNYDQVCAGGTGHTEAICVYYDPEICSYDTLLDAFFERVDVTTVDGQGRDYGSQYRTGVYYHTKEQEETARKRFEMEQLILNDMGKRKRNKAIATELKPAKAFWPAEKYHQQYLEKGGRSGQPQSAAKGETETIRCYG